MKKIYKLLLIMLVCHLSLDAQNTALQFDGDAESVSVPFKESLALNPEYTIEAWIFANEWKSLSWQGSLFSNDGQGPDGGFSFRCGDNGKLSLVISVDNVWNEVVSTSIMNEKQWHHVAGVVDNGSMRLYIDGQQVAAGTYSGEISIKTTPFTIGESTGFPGRVFDGAIDELRVWNTVRTADEISNNKTVDLAGTEAGLVAYFPMNDGSGTTVTNKVDAACSGAALETDDSNWVEGYKLPEFDASVKNISGIDRWHMKSRPVKMAVDVQNVGTEPISDVELTVTLNGEEMATEMINATIQPGEALSYNLSTPIDLSSESNPNIKMSISHPDDANSLNNETEITVTTRGGNVVNLFDNEQHNFGSAGQKQSNTIVLPGDLSAYEQLLLHISVSCPSGGCDPWDQTANVIALTDQGEFELARYITPYGIACGPWTVDVTDFRSVLAGKVTYSSFVQVFGQSGWLVNIDLEMIEGTSKAHSRVTPLYQTDYHVYGDPDVEDDLPAVEVDVASNTETSHVRLHMTGHGQGNTNNAAEFFQVTHEVMVNGNKIADHLLWKPDCAANSCSDQAGNWLFARAGWCPGQEVTPAIFNTTDVLTAGQSASLDYELQDYTNLLNTGYNNSGHTEPHYRIHSVLVENSTERYTSYTNLKATALNLEIAGTDQSIQFTVSNDGSIDIGESKVNLYLNGELVSTEDFGGLEAGALEQMELDFPEVTGDNNILVAEILAVDDQSSGDNMVTLILEGPNNVEDLAVASAFTINPNPTNRDIKIQFEETLLDGQMTVYSMDGRVVTTKTITNMSETIEVDHIGTYLIKAINTNGHTASKKVIVVE